MKPNMQEKIIDDRISTQEELDEVIGLLVNLDQLPVETALELLESSAEPSGTGAGAMLWRDADEQRPGVEIESLSNSIVGRRLMLN